jgi:ubiquinone/menaquinone biosynthesis C-methylase UbiE
LKSQKGKNQTSGNHYSIEVYKDAQIADEFDQEKFGSPVGKLFKKYQEELILRFLPDIKTNTVLDLGAGTGRISLPLSQNGARVTAADASFPMLTVTSEKARLQGEAVACLGSDAHHLPFSDRAFHAVISLRMMMHVSDWSQVLTEVCRVADRYVIVDFPPRSGLAGLAPAVHPVLGMIRKNYQPYRVFTVRSVITQLNRLGFRAVQIDRHLVLPFGFHRFIGSPAITNGIEMVLKRIGLTDLFGAPVTVLAERESS